MTSILNFSGAGAALVSILAAAGFTYVPLEPAPVFSPLPVPIVRAVSEDAPIMSTTTIAALVRPIAEFYGANPEELYETLKCESGFYPDRVGLAGELGVAQIYLEANPEVTPEQAKDPVYAISWSAKEFAAGREWKWTCWRMLYQ